MKSRIECFMIEPTGVSVHTLSRSTDPKRLSCPGRPGLGHFAQVDLGEGPHGKGGPSLDDPRVPAACQACGYLFTAQDGVTGSSAPIWRRVSTGEELRGGPRAAGPGAMWYADWMPFHQGPDGRCLVVMTPGGEWMIDSVASNCDLPEDREHRCWIRHGTPPNVTVDKNGRTCNAGAGSIMAGCYHGFLRNGFLEEC